MIASSGHLAIVQHLLDHAHADLTAHQHYALRYAATNGHTDTVRYLLQRGADPRASDDFALRASRLNGHDEVVKLLLAAAA
jgi:ankyrin repeat protein